MSHRPTGEAQGRLVAVLGPTNTGKTHLAVERMLGYASGMMGLPLRLLAREIYDRIVKARGPRAVALITGEEKILPPRAHYFICTVEAMPLEREVEFLAVDEVQLVADPERGHIFTDRLLHARGSFETMFLGSASMAPLVRRLLPRAEIVERERFSTLSYAGPRKLTRLPRRSAVVAFSADQVYGIAELIRRQRGGAAVVMGSLSPRTRNAQAALYQSGEVDFLVATDAIGMGLNMDIDHVAFAGLGKFDGRRQRLLHAHEVGQIAGRAGRFRRDGTFGVTGACPAMDDELVRAVETHRFDPLEAAFWRNSALDFDSLPELMRSLAATPSRKGLTPAEEALDERALRQLATDPEVARRCADRSLLHRLWDVCRTPDFRKITPDEHIALMRLLFDQLSTGEQRVRGEWMAGQHRSLDRVDGEIDALSTRLASVRTLAYVANRPDWLADAAHWRDATRRLEDRLSDTLHEKLMARFIDRRTSVLLRSLGAGEALMAGVDSDGVVTVEGHQVGRLRGLDFELERAPGTLEARTLRAAAQKAVAPEIARRLGRLASDPDDVFGVQADGQVTWRGGAAGVVAGGDPFKPQVRLLAELGPAPVRERAQRRLEAFVASSSSSQLKGLRGLADAVATGALKGLARGLAYRLIEAGGAIDRRLVERDLAVLSRGERRDLRSLGVRIGAFALHLAETTAHHGVALAFAALAQPDWRPPSTAPSAIPGTGVAPRALGLRGLIAVGAMAVPATDLQRLSILLAPAAGGRGVVLGQTAQESLGWSDTDTSAVLRGLGYAPMGRDEAPSRVTWRRRRAPPVTAPAVKPPPHSPFAALAALSPAPARARRRRRRRKPSPAPAGRVQSG
jgi:ATP-dependent RNA helicase SUPV3L1/SUV3